MSQTNAAEYPLPSAYPASFEYPVSTEPSNVPREFGLERKRLVFFQFANKPVPGWKRTFDVLVSIALAILLAPLLIGIAIFIRFVSGGPVFFRQERLGEMGKDFEILKFRTLFPSTTATEDHRKFVSTLSSGNQVVRKPELAGRLIPGGKFLRSWSLDELPQLFNIIRGEMSLIGPRPDVLHWYDYEEFQLKRFEVRPGITGLWQVSGKNSLTFDEMIRLDVEYVENRSLRLDFWIILKTIRVVLFGGNG